MLVFTINFVLKSIIYGWLRVKTGGIWAPCLASGAFTAIGALGDGGPFWLYISGFAILGWIPLGILCAWIILTGQLKPHDQTQSVT